MKTQHDCLTNSVGYKEGGNVWLYRLICMKRELPKLQTSWEGPYRVVNQRNNVVYRIQQNPRKMMLAHLDWFTPY
jgi:hypothetical protein